LSLKKKRSDSLSGLLQEAQRIMTYKLSKLNAIEFLLTMEYSHAALEDMIKVLTYGKQGDDLMFSNMGKLEIPEAKRDKNAEVQETTFEAKGTVAIEVESGLAVFHLDGASAPALPGGSPGLPEKGALSAYAVLQWGWMTKNSWRRTLKYDGHRGNSTMEDLARQFAELVMGEAFV